MLPWFRACRFWESACLRMRRRELELNELGWWGNWAELEWIGKDAYVLTSGEMPEVFFNRGGLLTCGGFTSSMDGLESRFRTLGFAPAIMVYESCSGATRSLQRRGYQRIDTMTVLAAIEHSELRGGSEVEVAEARSHEGWSRAYLLAFYGGLGLLPAVERAVSRIRKAESTLLEARLGGEVAGVLALHRTSRLVGAYCVGTVPRLRRRGVAGALLARAREIASSERRTLILQSLGSDGNGGFYLRRGFVAFYSKALMQKKG